MAEICLEMAVKRQLVSLLIYGTPSTLFKVQMGTDYNLESTQVFDRRSGQIHIRIQSGL